MFLFELIRSIGYIIIFPFEKLVYLFKLVKINNLIIKIKYLYQEFYQVILKSKYKPKSKSKHKPKSKFKLKFKYKSKSNLSTKLESMTKNIKIVFSKLSELRLLNIKPKLNIKYLSNLNILDNLDIFKKIGKTISKLLNKKSKINRTLNNSKLHKDSKTNNTSKILNLITLRDKIFSYIKRLFLYIFKYLLLIFIYIYKVFLYLLKIIELILVFIKTVFLVIIRIIKNFFNKIGIFILGILFSIIFIFLPFEVYKWFNELPNPDLLVVNSNFSSTKIMDRNGKLLYEIYVDKNYNPVTLSQIPSYVIDSTIAVEDSQFYYHKGIRIESILRAARLTLFEGKTQGGSTITQQLIKNVLLTPERTLSRKIKEAVLAVLVEARYSKDEILEMYLNNIPYGGSAWGVQSASLKYFNKNVWELDLAEASLLAGLPSSPSTYSPLYEYELAKQRQKYVLDRMLSLGKITEQEALEAYSKKLEIAPQTQYIRAPHFVNYVRKQLEEKYGKRYVELGGLSITTTLDLDLQENIQTVVKEEVDKNSYLGFSNAAVVVLDAKGSEILSYVGSKDYFEPEWGAFDVSTALRQPGSSIKPVTYALALANGYTTSTIIEDNPVVFNTPGSVSYKPVNYDGKYHGKVTLRSALANSYNIPAVKLANTFGPDNIVGLGRDLGLSNWEIDGTYGLSVTLGGKEVSLLDHTNLFASFARKGKFKEVSPILSVKDNRGYEIYKDDRVEREVLSEEVSYIIWDILSDNQARTPAFGFNNALVIPNYKVAVKTGTTDVIKDNWTMGFTPSYAVGVWVGNNDSKPMNARLASGLTGAAPIWNKVFRIVLEGKPNEIMERPSDVFVMYDKNCNKSEIFIKGSKIPSTLCPEDLNSEDKSDSNSKKD